MKTATEKANKEIGKAPCSPEKWKCKGKHVNWYEWATGTTCAEEVHSWRWFCQRSLLCPLWYCDDDEGMGETLPLLHILKQQLWIFVWIKCLYVYMVIGHFPLTSVLQYDETVFQAVHCGNYRTAFSENYNQEVLRAPGECVHARTYTLGTS